MEKTPFHSSFQHTLKTEVTLSGVGLHSGQEVALRIVPAAPSSGFCFIRTDVTPALRFPAEATRVGDTQLGTVLNHASGATLSTVEHLMAAFWGAGIDNATIYVDGGEIPILDGSSVIFLEAFTQAGITKQPVERQFLTITTPLTLAMGESRLDLLPYDGFAADVRIDFTDSAIGSQRSLVDFAETSFAETVSDSRTFGFLHEVEHLKSIGLARGGSLDNAIVLDRGQVLNPEGLRHDNEFARHKLLDLVGDLFLSGQRLRALVVAHRPGHTINTALAKQLQQLEITRQASEVPAMAHATPHADHLQPAFS